ASDCGIVIQTLVLAWLLQWKRLVPWNGIEYPELAKSLTASIISFIVLYGVVHVLPPAGSFPRDLLALTCGTAAWLGTAWLVLHLTGSTLPNQLISRFRGRKSVAIPTPLEQQL